LTRGGFLQLLEDRAEIRDIHLLVASNCNPWYLLLPQQQKEALKSPTQAIYAYNQVWWQTPVIPGLQLRVQANLDYRERHCVKEKKNFQASIAHAYNSYFFGG
jgi:hypothetical protein